ncbi:hypothetical protein PGT21_012051 [Puccinia graminis f. sp. tritici]|uniref:Uncharacterized protein n=1 Tax=Puccinia graminis f. sp. tritici TaxID=56615 RepID=A0A5B0PXE4_PUCGR|nr:hypothetical protein PGT21_012051 [Puccinia graminis f. sp. tritici]
MIKLDGSLTDQCSPGYDRVFIGRLRWLALQGQPSLAGHLMSSSCLPQEQASVVDQACPPIQQRWPAHWGNLSAAVSGMTPHQPDCYANRVYRRCWHDRQIEAFKLLDISKGFQLKQGYNGGLPVNICGAPSFDLEPKKLDFPAKI